MAARSRSSSNFDPTSTARHAAGDREVCRNRPASILIAEDDEDHRRALAFILRDEGYDVTTAECGEKAVALALKAAPDLAILDVDMSPGMDGFATCRRLHELLSPPPCILFVSAHTQVTNAVKGLDEGGMDYIGKPYDPEHLAARVRAALRVRREVEDLRVRVMHDPLTGLLSRGELESRARALIALGERSRRPFGCLIADIDRFKSINDTFGHSMGDAVLKSVADRITSTCREADSIFRLGGEEFVVLAPDARLAEAVRLAERIRSSIDSERIVLPLRDRPAIEQFVSISVGVAAWEPGMDFDVLLDAADQALYRAKEGGRNRVTSTAEK